MAEMWLGGGGEAGWAEGSPATCWVSSAPPRRSVYWIIQAHPVRFGRHKKIFSIFLKMTLHDEPTTNEKTMKQFFCTYQALAHLAPPSTKLLLAWNGYL